MRSFLRQSPGEKSLGLAALVQDCGGFGSDVSHNQIMSDLVVPFFDIDNRTQNCRL